MTLLRPLSSTSLVEWIVAMQGKKLFPIFVAGSIALGLNPSLTGASGTSDQMDTRRFQQFRSIHDVERFMSGESIEMDMVPVIGTHGVLNQPAPWGEQGMHDASSVYPVNAPLDEATDNYDTTIERVRGLTQLEDEEDAPSADALSLAIEFLAQARTSLYTQFPKGATAVREDGGVDVYWKRPGRIVQLAVPARQERPLSVYHRSGDEHGTDTVVSPEILAHWLEWFARA